MQKKFRKALIVGGSNGIGLAITMELSTLCNEVIIIGRSQPQNTLPQNVKVIQQNLLLEKFNDIAIDNNIKPEDINILIITAGFGRVAPFESFHEQEIKNMYLVNTVILTQIIHYYYPRIQKTEPFYCAVVSSIAGHISSPLMSLYGASKAAVYRLTESLNIELEKSNTDNRILDISPGSIKGTRFNGAKHTDLDKLKPLAESILKHLFSGETLFIPEYDTIYKNVIERYNQDSHEFGLQSYQYKINSGRMQPTTNIKIGYLSGTFDLFHIGHLNLLRRVKSMCDYLVVGVHKDASHKGKISFIPFEERCDIVRNIKYVDKVIQSMPEDDEIYKQNIVKYDYLFVGSDYEGTERFKRYEEYFADKDTKIIYIPYTKGTSSTQLRNVLNNFSKK